MTPASSFSAMGRAEPSARFGLALTVLLAQAATWAAYLVSTRFLQYWLPGYPTVDWLCQGQCTPAAFVPVVLPLTLVGLGHAGLFLGARAALGEAAGWRVLGLALASPVVLVAQVSTPWALAFFTSGVLVAARGLGQRELEVGAALLAALLAPVPVAVAALVFAAVPGPHSAPATRSGTSVALWVARAGVGLGVVLLASRLLLVWGPVDPVPLPGAQELPGVTLVGWFVVVPLVVGAAWGLLDAHARPAALALLSCVIAGLFLGTPLLRVLGGWPAAWLLLAGLSPRVHPAVVALLAMLQGMLMYHLAHQVPVL